MKPACSLFVGALMMLPSFGNAEEGSPAAGGPGVEPADLKEPMRGRIFHSAVWTGREMLVWGGGSEGQFYDDGGAYVPASRTWRTLSRRECPSPRWGHAAVWTGAEMLVWGGRSAFPSTDHRADGGAYDPGADRWTPIPADDRVAARSQMGAVWTGREMLVWGGFDGFSHVTQSGARYDPRSRTWTPIPESGAPEARAEPQCAWTGRELIVWGGISGDLNRTLDDGARFDPLTNRWTPISRLGAPRGTWGAQAVWTGAEVLVWGGARTIDGVNTPSADGFAYHPATDTWRRLPREGAPTARFFHTATWSGTHLLVWGGGAQLDGENRHFADGALYSPAENRWMPFPWPQAPAARGMHSAVWAGDRLVIFGGSTGGSEAFADAASPGRP